MNALRSALVLSVIKPMVSVVPGLTLNVYCQPKFIGM